MEMNKITKIFSILLALTLVFTLGAPSISYATNNDIVYIESEETISPADEILDENISNQDTFNNVDSEIQPKFAFLIPAAVPHITRIGGMILVRKYLKDKFEDVTVTNYLLANKSHSNGVFFNNDGFPIFPYKFQTPQMPTAQIKDTNYLQFKWADTHLKSAIAKDANLKKQFTADEIAEINKGLKPTGFTWHHHQNTGYFQLVKTSIHQPVGHTGGRAIWGSL